MEFSTLKDSFLSKKTLKDRQSYIPQNKIKHKKGSDAWEFRWTKG